MIPRKKEIDLLKRRLQGGIAAALESSNSNDIMSALTAFFEEIQRYQVFRDNQEVVHQKTE